MALFEEEESKKARIFQREKRQELQLIIERCNKIAFDYVCKPLERNVNIVFGSSIPRKIHLFANDKSVNSYPRRCFKENFPESLKITEIKKHENEADAFEQFSSFPFSSKVPRFQENLSMDAHQGYRKRKKVQEIPVNAIIKNSAFGTSSNRNFMITKEIQNEKVPGPAYIPLIISKKQLVHHSFGGHKYFHPAYEIVCTPTNLDSKCSSCEGEVKNVYWKNPKTQIVFCRKCYNGKVLEIKNKSKGVLDKYHKLNIMENDFHKMRHCEFFHEHHNTKAAILILTPKEFRKKLNRENFNNTLFKY